MANSPSEDDRPEPPDDGELGRPIDRDYVDPELLSLSRGRGPVGPVLAVSIVVFCVYFMLRLRADLAFSLQSDTPTQASSATAVVNKDGVGVNDFVRVTLRPDRSFALHIAPSEASDGHRITSVHGTRGKLWLLEAGSHWTSHDTYNTTYEGRLRYLSDMPFHQRLRSHVSKAEPTSWFVPTARLRQALEKKADAVVDAAGDPVPVTASTPVILHETSTDRAVIRAYLGERHPNAAAWKKSLVAAGVLTENAKPTAVTEEVVTWNATDPEGAVGVAKKLAAAKLFGARASPLEHRYQANWGTLSTTPTGISFRHRVGLPWKSISSVSLMVRREIPSDAMVLVANERPGAFWYMKLIYGALALFMVLFIWAFVHSVRRRVAGAKEADLAAPAEAS